MTKPSTDHCFARLNTNLALALICAACCLLSLTANATDNSNTNSEIVTLTANEIQLLGSFSGWPLESPADAGNELSGLAWAELIGQKLFHDPGLSGSNSISCGSCHQSGLGFSDGKSVATGAAQHVRNTQALMDVGLQRWFGWDGGADSLWAASLRPMLSSIEMNGNLESIGEHLRTHPQFMQALDGANFIEYGQAENETLIIYAAKAIAAYVRTIRSEETPFDTFVGAVQSGDKSAMAAYPDSAKRGLKIFLGEANCHMCHFGPNFSNGEFHDTGRPFFTAVGQVDPGRYEGIKRVRSDRYNLLGEFNRTQNATEKRKTETVKLEQANFGQWRTPSLRNLVVTAPYTHDGSLLTLRDVVDAYADIDPDRLHTQGESILKPLDLNNQAREDLVRFLETLSP